jgi:ATP-dependent helicase HrpB
MASWRKQHRLLPSGKKGRITYFDKAPPELSARLGDLIGYKERFVLMDGRVQGVFNILAPNYRTVQKTADLGSFWKNVYPAIKKELKRKYPRHPWPQEKAVICF